jgi:hypothetical protein
MFRKVLLTLAVILSVFSVTSAECAGNCGNALDGVPAFPFDGCSEENFQLYTHTVTTVSATSTIDNTLTVIFDA